MHSFPRGPRLTWTLATVLTAACGSDSINGQPALESGDQTFDAGGQPVDTGNQTSDDAGGQTSSFEGHGIPCDVQTVLVSHCASCHGTPANFGAPNSLTSFAEFHAASAIEANRARYETALDRITTDNPSSQMPPPSQPAMPEADREVLRGWLAAGAPESNDQCDAVSPDPVQGTKDGIDTAGLDCYKMVAHAQGNLNAPYKVGLANDTYLNFSFQAPWGPDKAAYAVVSRPVIDNSQVLHHWLLFQESGPIVDGEVRNSDGTHATGELVHGWAPGGTALDFREHGDVAFEFAPGAAFQVELHYNSSDPEALDASGVEICLQDKRPANIAGISWLGSDAILFTNSVQSTCVPAQPQPIHIVGVSPHMHLQGKHMTATVHRASGGDEVLYDSPFSFSDQAWYPRDVALQPGDTITTRCDYHQPVSFGKETTSEMCYLFTIAYPKGALSDGMLVGNLVHGGGACLGL